MSARKRIALRNDFHNTRVVIYATALDSYEYAFLVSSATLERAERKLCGMSDCMCRKITNYTVEQVREDLYILRGGRGRESV